MNEKELTGESKREKNTNQNERTHFKEKEQIRNIPISKELT